MENKDTTSLNTVYEIAKQELENLEFPYNDIDWEKIEVMLANQKFSKAELNKFSLPNKVEETLNVELLKKFNFSNVVFGLVILIGLIVLLFRLFDGSISNEQKSHEIKVETVQDIDMVSGMDTLKTITKKAIQKKTVPPEPPVTPKVTETIAVAQKTVEPVVSVPDKKVEAKSTNVKATRKVKMEVEEIDNIEITTPRTGSLIKRKKSEQAAENSSINQSNSQQQTSTPATITEPSKTSVQETEKTILETPKEINKTKRQKIDINIEQRPKSFRELDSIR